MLRRCQFLLVSLAVCVASVLPSFAWSEESFIGKDKLEEFGYYDTDPVVDAPMMMMAASPFSLSDSSLVASTVSFLDFLPSVRNNLINAVSFKQSIYIPGTGTIVSPGAIFYPSDVGVSPSVLSVSYGLRLFPFSSFTVSEDDFTDLTWSPLFPGGPSGSGSSFFLDYDVSSFNSSTFEFNGDLIFLISFRDSSSNYTQYLSPVALDIVVDGTSVKSYSTYDGKFDLSGFIYSGVQPVSNISLRVYWDCVLDIDFDIEYTVGLYISSLSTASLSSLLGTVSSPPSGMQDADNTLGDYDTAEDQYFDDAESAVGSLDTEVPDGMLGSAAMIGGMFNDLWTVLGDFSLIYFIPLLFSFFLWIIGRKRGGSG